MLKRVKTETLEYNSPGEEWEKKVVTCRKRDPRSGKKKRSALAFGRRNATPAQPPHEALASRNLAGSTTVEPEPKRVPWRLLLLLSVPGTRPRRRRSSRTAPLPGVPRSVLETNRPSSATTRLRSRTGVLSLEQSRNASSRTPLALGEPASPLPPRQWLGQSSRKCAGEVGGPVKWKHRRSGSGAPGRAAVDGGGGIREMAWEELGFTGRAIAIRLQLTKVKKLGNIHLA
ncbi:uncharacterized protein LOC116659843 [Camelus ferus]|uniref:Uncharacterized protein LOC116659843 n=1 Tax=Camelus ferus TaxID=419612 RepID=A0A8B8S2B4_CAMFR|nr:uncharacterized protein LOC116659843 [Camelus ferus]